MIQLDDVRKVYRTKRGDVSALDGVSLSADAGELLTIRGPSGSGKSTLLFTLGGMVHPTGGTVRVGGRDLYSLSARERAGFRANNIGFVFQMFHLVPYLSVLENVILPTSAATDPGSESDALELLERFRMTERLHHRPSELSTGERQRTALARALLNKPKLILADEPTGNLDPENSDEVRRYLSEFNEAGGTVVLVTHAQGAPGQAGRVVTIRDGRVEE